MNREQNYAYGKTLEECGEVCQIAGKITCFGFDSHNPDTGITNLDYLTMECGDVLAAIDFAIETGLLDAEAVERQRARKLHLHRNAMSR